MSTPATATRFASQKGRVLRAAARCFNEKGFSGTSLKDVANELGLTDAALYYYVRNKEELSTCATSEPRGWPRKQWTAPSHPAAAVSMWCRTTCEITWN